MTSYGLTPDNISSEFPVGPAFGAPNYTVIHNNGMDTRPLNQFDKTFQSSLQNERDNQFGTAFIGGNKRKRRIHKNRPNTKKRTLTKFRHAKCSHKKGRRTKCSHKHSHTKKRTHMKKRTHTKKRTQTKKRTHSKNKKNHTHSSHIQSHSSRKRKGGVKSILRKVFFGRGEPIGYTMDTKNTDSFHGALATPYPMVGYE